MHFILLRRRSPTLFAAPERPRGIIKFMHDIVRMSCLRLLYKSRLFSIVAQKQVLVILQKDVLGFIGLDFRADFLLG